MGAHMSHKENLLQWDLLKLRILHLHKTKEINSFKSTEKRQKAMERWAAADACLWGTNKT